MVINRNEIKINNKLTVRYVRFMLHKLGHNMTNDEIENILSHLTWYNVEDYVKKLDGIQFYMLKYFGEKYIDIVESIEYIYENYKDDYRDFVRKFVVSLFFGNKIYRIILNSQRYFYIILNHGKYRDYIKRSILYNTTNYIYNIVDFVTGFKKNEAVYYEIDDVVSTFFGDQIGIYGDKRKTDTNLQFLSDVLRNLDYYYHDDYEYAATYYWTSFNVEYTKREDKYIIGIELEMPYTTDVMSLSERRIFKILKQGFLTKYDRSIAPGVEFVSKPFIINTENKNMFKPILKSIETLKDTIVDYDDSYEYLFDYMENTSRPLGFHVTITKVGKHVSSNYVNRKKCEISQETLALLENIYGRKTNKYCDINLDVNDHHCIVHHKNILNNYTTIEVRLGKATFSLEKIERMLKASLQLYKYLTGIIDQDKLNEKLKLILKSEAMTPSN